MHSLAAGVYRGDDDVDLGMAVLYITEQRRQETIFVAVEIRMVSVVRMIVMSLVMLAVVMVLEL